MKYSHILLAIAFGGTQSYLGAEARDCDTFTSVDGDVQKILELHSPGELESFEGCTTLNGDIIIQSDSEGDFILNDVTEFHGDISTFEDSPEALSRFEMRVLENIENIHLLGLAGDVVLPKLEVVGDLELVQTSDSGTVDLRLLSNANSLSIRGSWTNTDLSLLKMVTVSTEFCGSQTCEVYGDERVFPYILVELPSLEKTDYFKVTGAVKSVYVPKLEVVGYTKQTDLSDSQGLLIIIEDGYDETLDFDAPNLHTLNGTLEVWGGVSSLSLGSLGRTNLKIILDTRVPLAIYSNIQTGSDFSLWGYLDSIYLPDMEDLGTIDLSYTAEIPCNDTLYQLWLSQPSYSDDWDSNNPCKYYNFPQDAGATDHSTATRSATITSTLVYNTTTAATSASGTTFTSGNTGRTGEGNLNAPDSTDAATQGNGTHQAFSITFVVGAAPLIIAVIWASLY